MQTKLFEEIEIKNLTIDQAATHAHVSAATIRNWIKTGYLVQSGKNAVTQASFDDFMANVAGKEKLHARANKRKKDDHDHQALTEKTKDQIAKLSGEAMGIAYENALSDAYRNKEGIYYTPSSVVADMFKNVPIRPDSTFLDPCCGSGNFIVEALKLGIAPENIYGFDIDENAVLMTKSRIQQDFGVEMPHIKVGNFLNEAQRLQQSGVHFDLIFTNPPWGKKIEKSEKERWAVIYDCGNSLDTTSLFMGASFSILRPNGVLGFLVQEAFFNITTFEAIRTKVLAKNIVRFVDYGKAFKGLLTKAQAIIVQNQTAKPENQVECCLEGSVFYRNLASFQQNPKAIFNFWTNEMEAKLINQLYAKSHVTLHGRAKWALGIVTGNNEKYCKNELEKNFIPIYKGSDITKFGLKSPTNFISSDFSNFQQVAPLSMYAAKEKLIYKFISSDLCFYCDNEQKMILNSANLLIPVGLPVSGHQLAQLLNSEIMNWLFKKLFATHKVLRGDLELLPIHVGYFERYTDFSENNYLKYLEIEQKENGTFRLKN